MPIDHRIDPSAKTIHATAKGILTIHEILKYVADRSEANALTFAELFDARDVTLDLSITDLQRIAKEMREAVGTQTPGPTAVVTNSGFVYGLARTYAALTKKDNPAFAVFSDIEEAQQWLQQYRPSNAE